MIRRIAACILCCFFLSGSILLPLGDFALMKDLPQMYRSYEKLTSRGERGIVDFVGDYLLGGKVILGHNKNDAPETTKSNVQFQHASRFCSLVCIDFEITAINITDAVIIHPALLSPLNTSGFHQELLRPPLALVS